MNPRERIVAVALLAIITLGGGAFLFYQLFFVPLRERDQLISEREGENKQNQDYIKRVIDEKPKLEHWRNLSLPTDPDRALNEYEKYFTKLMVACGYPRTAFTVTPGQNEPPRMTTDKKPVYTPLTFNITGHGSYACVVKMLERFYRTPILHQIKKLNITPRHTAAPGQPDAAQSQPQAGDLQVKLTVEALIVDSSEKRLWLPDFKPRLLALDGLATLLGGPTGSASGLWIACQPRNLAGPQRNYADIAAKNIFTGMPPQPAAKDVDVAQVTKLTDITRNGTSCFAYLHVASIKRDIRLCLASGGDTFEVRNNKGEVRVHGKVVWMDDWEVVFLADDKYYAIGVGDTLEQALRTPLTADRVKALRLTMAADKKPGTQ